MKRDSAGTKQVDDRQALALHEIVSALLRRFKPEPGMMAGSVYSDLHVNDAGLVAALAEPGDWSVRKIADELGAPDSTVSSALDRLETRRLVDRIRRPADRRVVHIRLTAAGRRLAARLRAAQIESCRTMLTTLNKREREDLIRLAGQAARGANPTQS